MSLANTTREFDVHMGTDGADFECVACHQVKRDTDGNMLSHGIGGMPYHSVDEGVMKQCDDCHGDRFNIHVGTTVESIVTYSRHARLPGVSYPDIRPQYVDQGRVVLGRRGSGYRSDPG